MVSDNSIVQELAKRIHNGSVYVWCIGGLLARHRSLLVVHLEGR